MIFLIIVANGYFSSTPICAKDPKIHFPFLNIGITLATFILFGNIPVLKTCVTKSVRGLIMVGASF